MVRSAAALAVVVAGCASQQIEPALRGMPTDDPRAALSAVWVGHATVLLRFGPHYVITDPNLGGSIGTQQRVTPASLRPGELPPLEFAVISHPHIDHFDAATMRRLRHLREVFHPKGAEPYMKGLRQATRGLAPWETVERGPFRITAVPISHSGGRYLVDSLWNHAASGYVIEAYGRTVFFAGDTGYDAARFKEIGRRYPHIDLALIPIAPARGGNKSHASPQEGVRIFEDVGARYMIPIHFEAYRSMVVPIDEPRRLLAEEAERRGLSQRIFALRTGERWALPDDPERAPWVLRDKARELARQ
jgi:L-ascorbate metabolism protein UlaG (beta-lactamase superfamily)